MNDLLAMAYDVASTSPDPSNQNGALIVNNKGVILHADCNRFTEGIVPSTEQLLNRDWKLAHIEHAERTAILVHGNCDGLTLVCPWFACHDCAKAIVLSGIKKVIGHKQRMDTTPERWMDSVTYGNGILDAAGVERVYFDGSVDGLSIIVNGKKWSPR